MRINNNIMAMNTHRQLGANQANGAKSLEKLSSGFRINRAGDDAAGLSISEKMRGQIRGLNQATRNAQDSISLIQTAEGALNETHSILQRMRELAVQSANATNTDEDRSALQNEISQLKSEIDRIGNNTEFNTKKLINGELSGSQIGGEGTQIGTATAAKLESGVLDPGDFDTDVTNYQVNLDGKIFELTGVDTTDGFSFFADLETKLIAAIDTHNLANPNDKVEYATFNIEVTDASKMNFTITSGTTGSNSKIEIKLLHEDGKTIGTLGELGDALTENPGTYTAGSDGKLDSAIDIDSTDPTKLSQTFSMNVNGHNINVELSKVDYTADSDMTALASDLKTQINSALNDYKDLTGIDFGTVDVLVKDGAFQITSSKSDTVTLEFGVNATTEALGIAGSGTTAVGGLNFHIGSNKGQSMNLQINDMRTAALNVADVDISTREGADNAISSMDAALKKVSEERANLGAVQNRLEHTISNLGTSAENLQAAESRIRDVDMAAEMMEFTKNNILQQAANAMLAQANMAPQSVLQLLG